MVSPAPAADPPVYWALPWPIVKVSAPPLLVPPALLLVSSTSFPAPAIVIGALTTIEWKADSVSIAGVLHEIAASTLMSPAPPVPAALVDSVTFVPEPNVAFIVAAAAGSIVRSAGSSSHVPALP